MTVNFKYSNLITISMRVICDHEVHFIFVSIYPIHTTAISLQPEQFVYSVNEFDPSVTVCAQLAGNFEQTVVINVTTQSSQIPPTASKLFV